MSPSVTMPTAPAGFGPGAGAAGTDDGADWFEGLAFEGPLDPGGTLFAFVLALGATVGLVVLVAAVVRAAGLG